MASPLSIRIGGELRTRRPLLGLPVAAGEPFATVTPMEKLETLGYIRHLNELFENVDYVVRKGPKPP